MFRKNTEVVTGCSMHILLSALQGFVYLCQIGYIQLVCVCICVCVRACAWQCLQPGRCDKSPSLVASNRDTRGWVGRRWRVCVRERKVLLGWMRADVIKLIEG